MTENELNLKAKEIGIGKEKLDRLYDSILPRGQLTVDDVREDVIDMIINQEPINKQDKKTKEYIEKCPEGTILSEQINLNEPLPLWLAVDLTANDIDGAIKDKDVDVPILSEYMVTKIKELEPEARAKLKKRFMKTWDEAPTEQNISLKEARKGSRKILNLLISSE